MGADAGFDMVPRLSKGVADRHNWGQFIRFVKDHYEDDPKVEVKPNYICFKAGERPMLPFEGHKLLRFSSKVTGAAAAGVDGYIDTVTHIAKLHFRSRVRYWNELYDLYGTYSWNEVNKSLQSYEQPDEPALHNGIASFLTGNDSVQELGDTRVFEVKNISGKGKGLVAKFNISKGTQIMCETPLFTAPPTLSGDFEAMLAKKLKTLSKEVQRQFLSLHNKSPGKNPFTNIFKTNALPCGAGSAVGAVYPTICRINHSCYPNSHNSWDDHAKHETIYAVRLIKAGEEITIPYNDLGPSAERRAKLKQAFNFDCDCHGCMLPSPELQESDLRQLKIRELDDAIGDLTNVMMNPEKSLRHCRTLLQTLEIEYEGHNEPHKARLFFDAFQICIAHGDQARAVVFAEKSYQARVICEGEDTPESQRVKALSGSPSTHYSFEVCSSRWKTAKTMIPKGLSTVQFEKWLFRAGT